MISTKYINSNYEGTCNDIDEFNKKRDNNIKNLGENLEIQNLRLKLQDKIQSNGYSYLWSWLGIPVIQTPEDLILLAEIIQKIRPKIVIETGFARGGSAVFIQSLMDSYTDTSIYIAVDIDVRKHNIRNLQSKVPNIFKKLNIIESDSTAHSTKSKIDKILERNVGLGPRLIHLDSNHTEKHVSKEIEFYDEYLKIGDCLIIGDTVIGELSQTWQGERPWSRSNSPMTAIQKSQIISNKYKKIENFDQRAMFCSNRGGYFIKIKE